MNKLFTLAVLGILVSTGCSNRNVVEVQEHKRYVQPVWFTECKDSGSESNGWKFWSSTDYYYSCGSGMSGFESAAHIKATQVAKRNLADRLVGQVSSGSKIIMTDTGDAENLTSSTSSEVSIYNKIPDTFLRDYAKTEKYSYKRAGYYHSFVMIKLRKSDINRILGDGE